jgi:lipopolysaccharide export system permease protein
MNILDRQYLVSFFRQYLIVLSSLLSLYVVVDLFTNLNDFTGNKSGFGAVVNHIVGYYSVQVLLIFDRLSEAITLIGAVFTVALMQRNNELLPQLSAGVPTRRVILPVLVGGLLTTAFGPLVNEFVIPLYADVLTVPRDDPELRKPTVVRGGYDPDTGAHVVAEQAFRRELRVTKFEYTSAPVGEAEPSASPGAPVAGTGLLHLTAVEAYYVPPAAGDPLSGGWKLFNASPAEPERTQRLPKNLRHLDHGRYFLKTEVSFDAVTRRASWYMFAPTSQLWEMLNESDGTRQTGVAVLFHSRLVRPLVGLTMLVLGLAIVLRDQNRHVFISAGACLAVSVLFYIAVLACKYAGDSDLLPATLAAWLPVMLAGPVAVALFDAIHT